MQGQVPEGAANCGGFTHRNWALPVGSTYPKLPLWSASPFTVVFNFSLKRFILLFIIILDDYLLHLCFPLVGKIGRIQDWETFKVQPGSYQSVVYPIRGFGVYTYRCNILLLRLKLPSGGSHAFSQEPPLFRFP